MRILHAADLHLDTPFTGRPDADIQYLKKALLSIPDKLVRVCREYRCDLLLLSGDLFDGAATTDSIRVLKTALAEAGVPVFIAPGNHDFCSPDSPYATEVWPENVHIFRRPIIESVSLPEVDCRIYGAGFESMDCPALLKDFRAEGSETYHIAVLHGDPLHANSPYCPITQPQIADSGLHYLGLGHIHKAGAFTAGETLCAWPGCPMGRGNDETGEKGVYLVTIADHADIAFVPLDAPKFYDLELEVLDNPESTIKSALPPIESNDFYRITLTGECEPFDLSALRLPHFSHLEIRDHTLPPADLWGCIDQDNLEGVYFKLLQDALESGEEVALLAARISRRILDGREVTLP